MRILDKLSSRKLNTNTRNASSKNNSFLVGTLFQTELQQQEIEVNNYGQEIDVLRKEIDAAGDILEKEPTLPNFKFFRDILSKIAKRISKEAYRLEKCGGTPQNPRYYELIITINFEADKLYNLIIREQKDNMAITAKVIGIKGIVVDLVT